MKLHDLFESTAEKDLSEYQEVDAIRSALIRYLMKDDPTNHYGFEAIRFADGVMALTLRGRQIGLEEKYANLWFLFGKEDPFSEKRTNKGGYSKFTRSGEPVIRLNLFDDIYDTEAVRNKIIHSWYVHKVLEHELVHYIDSFRNPAMLDPNKEHLRKDSQGNTKAGYWNSPEEFNAYSTNIARPLLIFLKAAKSDDIDPNGLQRFAKGLKISKDFNETLEAMFSKLPYEVNEFVKRLRGKNRKALLKRLYVLHQEALKYL